MPLLGEEYSEPTYAKPTPMMPKGASWNPKSARGHSWRSTLYRVEAHSLMIPKQFHTIYGKKRKKENQKTLMLLKITI